MDATGDFSSDDEGPKTPSKRASNVSKGKQSSSSRKSQGSPKKTPMKVLEESVDIEMNIDIPALDDDQLFEMLKKNGVEVGPIVASTRKFYEKKLSAALAGENATNGTNGTKEFSDTEPEDEEEEQPAVVEVVAKRRTPRFCFVKILRAFDGIFSFQILKARLQPPGRVGTPTTPCPR